MNSVDLLRDPRNRIRWVRVDPTLPPGIHQPKLQGDVGWDLECMQDTIIEPMCSVDVPVNLAIELPPGFYADIRNRSSMARRGLYVDQNVVDTGYRGPLFVLIRNMSLPGPARLGKGNEVAIAAGDRIAQLVFHRIHPVWIQEASKIDESTERGLAGFGSTGT